MRKIIWAVDPYQDQSQRLAHDARLLSTWFGENAHIKIIPVFVLTSGVRLMPFGSFKELLPALTEETRQTIGRLQRQLAHLPVAHAKILIHPSGHVENVASMLLDFADEKSADLIALRTQGKRGLKKLFLGSLAETLVKRAKLPVLVLEAPARARKTQPHSDPLQVKDTVRLRKIFRVA